MFQNVNTIQIKGGCYDDGATLENILSQRLNIVYGRNGSGKSSLAKAIYDYAHNAAEPKFEMSFSPEVSEDAKARMFVYSEDFVLQSVKLATDGLEQIVMIGEQVDLSNKEDELKEEEKQVSKLLKEANDSLEKNKSRKDKAESELLTTIKGDYAARERDFRTDLTNKPRVNTDTLLAIYQKKAVSASYGIASLTQDISEGTKTILGATNAQRIIWTAPNSAMPDTIQGCSDLLTKKVQQVELDERDKYLITILSETERINYIHSAQRDIVSKNANICPLCQQPISAQSLEALEAKIKRVLNKDVENYKAELDNTLASIIDIYHPAPLFSVDTYNADIHNYNEAVAKVNQALADVRIRLQAKANNLFNAEQALDLDALRLLYSALTAACNKLQEDVNTFNKTIDDKNELEKALKEKNQILAYLENQVYFDGYYATINAIEQTEQTVSDLNGQLKAIQHQLKDIASQRSHTKIAIDFINSCLSSVFFDHDRLVLEDANGKFILKSNGKAVAPDSVSTGERNIIGLAYFFATLYENTSESERFHQPYLVIIDDPITSFDQDNRLGVMTFLKEKLHDIVVKCDDSKVLIMSHDLRTINLLVSLSNEIDNKLWYKEHPQEKYEQKPCYVYQLHNHSRKPYTLKNMNEYSQMLTLLYDFAKDTDPDQTKYVGIGNTIRRVLETFSTMMLNNSDYARLVDNERIHLFTPRGYNESDIHQVYRRVLTRIILNSESHSATQIDQNSYESTFTRESLQILARYTLTFILSANEQHLKSCKFEDGWKKQLLEWNKELVLDEIRG